jgi:hypothetical protein
LREGGGINMFNKVMDLTQEQYDEFNKSKNQVGFIRRILGIPKEVKLNVGDTAVQIGAKTNPLEVYRAGEEHRYYIVIFPMDETLAFAYSIYPRLF